MLLGLSFGGGGICVYTKAAFLHRENGSWMHRKDRWPGPSSPSMKTNVCFAGRFISQSEGREPSVVGEIS